MNGIRTVFASTALVFVSAWPAVLVAEPLPSESATAEQPTQTTWPADEIELAKARCTALLKGLDVVAVPAAPIREGECGAPAPMQLVSVGKSPQVTFSPTVTATCDLIAALHKWTVQDLQPLARRYLGAPLIRFETMSSYSCRHAYGRVKNNLSEHGRANAVDVRGFITANGETTDVLADWGPTAREVQAQVAAAGKSPAQLPEGQRATAVAKGNGGSGLRPTTHELGAAPNPAATADARTSAERGSGSGPQLPSVTVGAPGIAIDISSPQVSTFGLESFPQPSRLGGPKASEAAPPTADARTQFMRGAHAAACRIFGTVLGPESNNAHRNHFHVDMAERSSSRFCE